MTAHREVPLAIDTFIFTGKESLVHGTGDVARIVKKCTDHDPSQRYSCVRDLIVEVETLVIMPTETPA